MRVVVSCVPQTGHIMPLLPLARAFADRGDEVVIASGSDAETFVGTELPFRAVGPALSSWLAVLSERTRGIPGDGLAPSRVLNYFIPRLFGEIGTALIVDDLLTLCRELEPALVVFDPYLFAAPLVAAVTGVPAVLHSIGPLMDRSILELVADAVSPIWREFGMDVPPLAGVGSATTLTICPASLDPGAAGVHGAQPLRPVPLPLSASTALAVSFARPEYPLVYLTLGTFSNNDLVLFRLVLDALEDEPVNVLATIGRDNDPSVLTPLPDNARVEQYLPQGELLPYCSAVVHHAGAGTMFGVLAHGLPSLVLPQSADNFMNAGLLERAGAALVLVPGDVSGASVRSGLRAVLDTTSYRRSARKLADEICSMPSPAEVAARLASNAVVEGP
ncbi:MAG: glycosyltransferase [Acidimicrobiales bacterium]